MIGNLSILCSAEHKSASLFPGLQDMLPMTLLLLTLLRLAEDLCRQVESYRYEVEREGLQG